jgi:hypothetical protein
MPSRFIAVRACNPAEPAGNRGEAPISADTATACSLNPSRLV